jgi:hypothetical protein
LFEQQLTDNPTTKHFNVDEFACLVGEILNKKDWDSTIPGSSLGQQFRLS